MTNTIHVPAEIIASLSDARGIVARIEAVQECIEEVDLQGLRPDDAFCGVDAVVIAGDELVTFEVLDWDTATVRVSLAHIVTDPEHDDDFSTDVAWQVDLVQPPRRLFAKVLMSALQELANS